jgi:cell division protein FtsW (lipid II flippase)
MRTSVIAALQVIAQSASSTGSSTPRRLAYLPEQHVDFIFSARPERFSIAGLAAVVLLLLALITVLRRRRAKDKTSPDE